MITIIFYFTKKDSEQALKRSYILPGSGDEWLSLNLNVIALDAFEYNNAVIVVILSNGEIHG
jgi:hypothetical protein